MVERQSAGCQKLQTTAWLNPVLHRMPYICIYMATVGVNGLISHVCYVGSEYFSTIVKFEIVTIIILAKISKLRWEMSCLGSYNGRSTEMVWLSLRYAVYLTSMSPTLF